jgi:hypothetical protein
MVGLAGGGLTPGIQPLGGKEEATEPVALVVGRDELSRGLERSRDLNEVVPARRDVHDGELAAPGLSSHGGVIEIQVGWWNPARNVDSTSRVVTEEREGEHRLPGARSPLDQQGLRRRSPQEGGEFDRNVE